MAWIRLDDQIAHHPKFIKAGLSAWVWVCCIGFAQKYLTDGFIPADAIFSLSSIREPEQHIEVLVKAGLLEPCDNGYQIHDYLEFNDSAETVRQKRHNDRVRKESERNPRGIQPDTARIPSGVLARAPASHPIPSVPDSLSYAEVSFQRFWDAYPKQTNRSAAMKVWMVIAPTTDHVETIVAGLEKQKAESSVFKDLQYAPSPAKWLENARWTDAIVKPSANGNGKHNQPKQQGAAKLLYRPFECPHETPCDNRNNCSIASRLNRPLRKAESV